MMHWSVVAVEALPDYRIAVKFADGTEGVVDLTDDLWGPMFEPLKDPARFAQVTIDREAGAVCWPDGPDLAPDAMYDEIKRGRSATR
jgi:hypothetical protein